MSKEKTKELREKYPRNGEKETCADPMRGWHHALALFASHPICGWLGSVKVR